MAPLTASHIWRAERSDTVILYVTDIVRHFSVHVLTFWINIFVACLQEDVLGEIAKGGGGILASIGAGKKFGGLDIKRVYFGYVSDSFLSDCRLLIVNFLLNLVQELATRLLSGRRYS